MTEGTRAVMKSAIRAWNKTERKYRAAMQTVIRTRAELAELDRVIRSLDAERDPPVR